MASLSEYLDGVIRVPIRLLTSDGFAECPSTFATQAAVTELTQFLNNPQTPITGIVTPDAMMQMLRALGVTLARFRETRFNHASALTNHAVEVGCLIGSSCLSKAKEALGDSYECLVRVYCLPTGRSPCIEC